MADKFLYLKESETDGTLYAQDGGVAIIWHNGEYLVGQCYRERISPTIFQEQGIGVAFEEMIEDSSNSAMFDFEDEDNILPHIIEQLADWLVAPREEDFLDNLILFDYADYDNDKIGEELDKVTKAFFNNEHFLERVGE